LTIEATAQAVDNDPVTAMRLIVDGRPWGAAKPIARPAPGAKAGNDAQPDSVAKSDSAAQSDTATNAVGANGAADPAAPASASWTLELPLGKHVLAVKAETDDSYALSPNLAARRGAEAPPAGNLYVLAIGGSTGPNGADPNDAASARAVAKSFQEAGAGQFDRVIVRSLTGGPATAPAIEAELDAIERQATPADTAIVYYAGPAQASGDEAHLEAHFIDSQAGPAPSDVARGFTGASLKEHLARLPGHVALILDARRQSDDSQRRASAGFCGQAQDESGDHTDLAVAELLRALLTEDYGVAVFSTIRGAAAAGATPGPSPLARALGEGLSGKADDNKDGVVQLDELGDYATGRTRELSAGAATPTVERPAGAPSFPLGRSSEKPTGKPSGKDSGSPGKPSTQEK
jgi:hypothetical protein